MQRVRLFGLALMAVFALGVVAAATASAAEKEAGFLYLTGESGQVTFVGSGKTSTLTSPAGVIKCTTVTPEGHSTQTEKHITTGLVNLHFAGCTETKGETTVTCKTEGDETEILLVLAVFTLFNALTKLEGELQPGIAITIVEKEDKPTTLKIKCGAVSIVEVKGTVLGLLLGSLTADVTSVEAHFVNAGEICDKEDTFCKTHTQGTAEELLANFSGKFEKATEQALATLPFNKMVLIDD